jgi:hypothetical protein
MAPAPSLNTPSYTQKLTSSRREAIQKLTGNTIGGPTIERWVGRLDKTRLTSLDKSIAVCLDTSMDPAAVREQKVIRGILASLAHGSIVEDDVVAEALMLRAAFCSEWSRNNQPTTRNAELKSYVYGIRPEGIDPMPLDTEEKVNGAVAKIRFAYELSALFPNEDLLPTEKVQTYAGFSSVVVSYRRYKDSGLADFIAEHPEDTGYLIGLAAEYRTCDAQALRGLYENSDGSASLSTGWL